MAAELACYSHTILCRLGDAGIALLVLSVPAIVLAFPMASAQDVSLATAKKICIGGIVALVVGFLLWLFSPARC